MNQQILKNLNNLEKIEEFRETIEDIIVFDSVGDARKIIVELEALFSRNPDFEKADYSLFSVYNNFLISLKFVAIFDLSDKEIFNLLSHNLDYIFKYPEYDLERKIKYKISNILSLENRDEFKTKVRQALLSNKMKFGQGKIVVSGLEQEATISTWLKDCYMKLGINKIDSLKINEYLVNDSNTKNLSAKEKINLKILLNFFEKMKVSSSDSPLFEESFVAILPNQEIMVVSSGQPEKINLDLAKSLHVSTDYKMASKLEKSKFSDQDDDLFLPEKSLSSSPKASNINVLPSVSAIPSAPKPLTPIEELEQSLVNYSEESFEYKALLQEIKRLKKIELKKLPKSDVKK